MATGKTNAGGVADLSVTTEKIADKAVTTEKIADKAVTTTQLGDASVGTTQLDALSVTAAKLAALAVETAKIKNGAVTRAKLAQDALFSPYIVSSSRNIVASDIGGTLQNNWEESATYTLTQAVSATLPMGAELAVLRGGTYEGTTISIVGSGIRFGIPDNDMPGGPMYPNATLKLKSYLDLVAIRKIAADNVNGDLWAVYGDVEVVS